MKAAIERPRFRLMIALLLLGLAFFCYRLGLGHLRLLQGSADLVMLQNCASKTAADYTAMQTIEQATRSPVAFALWAQSDKQVVTTHTGRRAEVSLITIRGDTRLVLPIAPTLAPGDRAGCLMDSQTAFDLTGGGSAVGATVLCQGREYTIRDTFDAPRATVLLQASPHNTQPLPHVAARPNTEIDTFILRHGLFPGLKVTGDFYVRLATLPLLAAPATLVLLLLGRLLGCIRRWRGYPIRRAVAWAALAAIATGCLIALLGFIPPDYIPPRWSDFGFWSRACDTLAADAGNYLTAAHLRPDLYFLGHMAGSLWALLACPLIVAGDRMGRDALRNTQSSQHKKQPPVFQ